MKKEIKTLDKIPTFIHVPKTGGLYLKRCFLKAKVKINLLYHYPARELKEKFGDNYIKQFSFAVIRNPYERFLSACNYNKITNYEDFSTLLKEDVKKCFTKYKIRHVDHFNTQESFITDYNGNIIVKHIHKFNELETLPIVLKDNKLDITSVFNLREIKSSNWSEILNDKTKENIKQIYKEDFELWEHLQ